MRRKSFWRRGRLDVKLFLRRLRLVPFHRGLCVGLAMALVDMGWHTLRLRQAASERTIYSTIKDLFALLLAYNEVDVRQMCYITLRCREADGKVGAALD